MKTLKRNDRVWIDSAPLVASPVETKHLVLAIVMQDEEPLDQQLYLYTGTSILYVSKKWLRDAPKETP